jgi:Lrp/AsnC family transcriptional regulator for asnA, asnC and gidA
VAGMTNTTTISAFDYQLIQILSQDARASVRRIADLMDSTESTVRYHLNKLEREGIIKGYSLIVDTKKIGLSIFVTIGIQCEPARTNQVAKAISKSPHFYLVWVVTGAHNIHAKGVFRSAEEMQQIVGEVMSQTQGILSYHLSLMFNKVKDPYMLSNDIIDLVKNSDR